jgi:hypothetical protein
MRNSSLRRSTRNLLLATATAAAAASLPLVPAVVAAASLDVCPAGCAYSQLAPALAAAHDGDTITMGAGTYNGGLAVTHSVRILGAGAGRTVIKGGGPALTIGTYLADAEPTVSIDGVTITGGVTHSSPLSVDWVGAPNVIAGGGGIEILPSANYGTGATVRISNSAITSNRSIPTATLPIGPECLGGPCSFAWAKGGGIDNWGALTLTGTTVSDNLAAGVASDADGGGIDSWWPSSLVIRQSRISGNRAIAAVPNGRYAEGGGIFTDEGIHLTITDSSVSGNTASLSSTQPFDVGGGNTLDMNANGGGIHVGDGSTVSILRTAIDANLVSAADPNGRPVGFDSGLHPGDGPLTLRDGSISNNRVVVLTASSEAVGPSGSALDLNGQATVSGMRIQGNFTSVSSPSGLAWATAAVYSGGTGVGSVISDSVISGNSAIATTTGGQAYVWGGGVINEGVLTLRGDLVKRNTAVAVGPSGAALGGGVYNGLIGLPDPPVLTLNGTIVTGNRVTGTAGITLQGGGIFSTEPVTRSGSSITGNRPDNCTGC